MDETASNTVEREESVNPAPALQYAPIAEGMPARVEAIRWVVGLLGASIVPFMMQAVELYVTRQHMGLVGNQGDVVFHWIGLFAGLAFICVIPVHWVFRLLTAVIYFPIMSYALGFFGLLFVGVVFGHWL